MKTIILSGAGKNSLSTALMERTLAEVQQAKDEPIFMMGDGDTFSAGLNLKEVASLDLDGMTKFLNVLEALVKALYEYPAPVVAWINGHAIAGGCVVALCADMRVLTARDGVRIGLNEVPLGLRFPPITLAMIRARLTAPACERVILEGELYDAKQALRLGLADTLGEESEARALCTKLAGHPREIFSATKLLLRGRLEANEETQKRFRETDIPYWASPERRSALLSVLDRNKKK